MLRRLTVLFSLGMLSFGSARAQPVVPPPDTVYVYEVDTARVYDLGEVYVTGSGARQVSLARMQQLSLAQIERHDAASLADVARSIPAATVQTNSRGETLLYLRNGGERQIALFFDGALLNVPWDYRIDMALLPAHIVGAINVSKGVSSMLYGANTLGGVVNLMSRSLANEGRFSEAAAQIGNPLQGRGYFTHMRRRGGLHVVTSFGYAGTRGASLPARADLPFGQVGRTLRTNTDATFQNGLFRAAYDFPNGNRVAASVLHIQGEKGVAPEGHKDPQTSNVRFWRYPNWQHSMLILSGRFHLDPHHDWNLGVSTWVGRFTQDIDQYRSASYDRIAETQNDLDWTNGARLVLTRGFPTSSLRFSANGLTSSHRQMNLESDALLRIDRLFRQHLFSVGAEYEIEASSRQQYLVGLSLDGLAAPSTADQPSRGAQTALSVVGGTRFDVSETLEAKAFMGSKTRFPTMRELFDTALGRFVLNPDLKPERSGVAEVGLRVHRSRISGESTFFISLTDNAIDQERVVVEGVSLRRRVNREGSRVFGLETHAAWRPVDALRLNAHLTGVHGRAYDAETRTYTLRLQERPALLSTLSAQYVGSGGFGAFVSADVNGQAFSLDEAGSMVPLGWYGVVDARLSRLFQLRREPMLFVEVFLRVDNLTDTVALPQLGLPGPGRSVQGGIKLGV